MPTVTFQRSGHSITLDSGKQLIDLEDTGKCEVPFGCRAASCATCLITVIEGSNNLSPKTEDEIDLLEDIDQNTEEMRLACQCTLLGDVVIEAVN